MIFVYLILTLIAIRAAVVLWNIFTGRHLQHHHEWQHGYHEAQANYRSMTGLCLLRTIIQREIDQDRFTRHWYGAACYLADAEGDSWPRPWGNHIYPRTTAKIGDWILYFFNGLQWIGDNPVPATVVLAGGVLLGAVLI